MGNAYDLLGLNDIEVLEDPAVQADAVDPSKATKYRDVQYKNKDDCHLGISNGVAGGVPIAAGATVVLEGTPSSPFKPKAFTIPSYLQVDLFVVGVVIGPFNAIEGDPVPAAVHSEVSFAQAVSWPMIQTNGKIKITLLNAGAVAKANVACSCRGIRFRE